MVAHLHGKKHVAGTFQQCGPGLDKNVSVVILERVLLKTFTLFRILDLEPYGSYLVDPASSHMLVSKTKPCMSKYK
jgi:hypothetical protein